LFEKLAHWQADGCATERAGSSFCPEHIWYTYGEFLMKVHKNVHHYEKPSREA
jgi:hypothetical protein